MDRHNISKQEVQGVLANTDRTGKEGQIQIEEWKKEINKRKENQ